MVAKNSLNTCAVRQLLCCCRGHDPKVQEGERDPGAGSHTHPLQVLQLDHNVSREGQTWATTH